MASTNLILAVPTADSSVSYNLPANDSAKLSFAPEDIDGLKLDANGGLVISFVEGGNVTLSNFQSFIDNGNTLSLADGTEVDPKLLFNALGGEASNPFPTSDALKIGIPAENSQQDITLEPGKKYLFNFDLSETQGADVKDGKMIISFANGGKIVVTNYETAMASATPPELSLASKTCVVTGDELITNIQQLAKSGVVDPTVLAAEELEEAARAKSKIANADMQGQDDIGPGDQTNLGYKVAKVEPAAGNETNGQDNVLTPEELAAIETAAGGPAAGNRNSGYGYGSRPGSDPFVTNRDIGPIDPTLLNYRAPLLEPSRFLDRDEDPNTNPIAANPDAQYLDETNLSGGPISVSDTISINYGSDGNGGVRPNGTFSSDGSKTGGDLSSHGVDVVVTVVGNTYVGMAGDVKVFDLVINPQTGAYTFTQYEQLDHADGNDANDTIGLNFGFTAKDKDGDSVKTTVKIVIADDAPTISGDEKTIDETDLGPIAVNGTLAHDFGEDGAGAINTTGSFTATGSVDNNVLTSSGVPVEVTSTATGYTGTANGVVVFTLTIDPATGDYTYTQFKNLDHADNSNPDDIITLTFGTKIVDYDGDTATAPIIINIKDDAPTVPPPCGCGGDDDQSFTNAEKTVDETNLAGVVSQSGTLVADFGADAPGSYSFKSGDFQPGGSLKGGALTHNGVPVVVSIINGVYTGMAGDVKVFTLELNGTTGDYKFTLLDNLDHQDASNPDDVITLDFGVLASDYEGDSIEGNIRINVKDDAPVANDDINTYDTTFGVANGNVITGLNGGPGAADQLSTDGWSSGDNSNKVVKIAFGDNEVDVPATGSVSIDGANGTLTINADGTYSYKAFDINNGGGSEEKTFVGGPALPDFDESEALDGAEQQSLGVAPGNLDVSEGDVVTVNFVSEVAGYSNSLGVFTIDANGNLRAEKMLITNSDAPPGPQSYTVGSGATAVGFFMIADGNNANANYAGIDFSTGTLNFVYNYGQPGARDAKANDDGGNVSLVFTAQNGIETVLSGPLYFSTDRGGSDNLNADDSIRVVSGIPNGDDNTLRIGFEDLPDLGDKDYNDLVFDISIKGKDCGCGPDDVKDKFVYTLQDGDGDRDTATLTLNGKDLTDDKPIIADPAKEVVDETNLKDGTITETGAISVNFGHDGPGTVAGNGSFTSGGSKLNGQLTSGGVAISVSLVNGTYVGKAGDVTVFTMKFEDDGKYSFKLFEQLDHADGNDDNDVISLNFGVKATDCDGDTTTTTVVVKVKDDAPVANDDGRATGEGQTITGNVTSNDVPGQDTPATVTKVTINGNEYTVPNTGTVVIAGTYGTLTIDKTGQYSYTANGNNPDGTDNFTYTLRDRDGDTDNATLCIQVTPDDDCPVIVKPQTEVVDETNLKDGVITETGTVTADFGSDGPGTFAGNNNFSSGGSRTNDTLSHNGTPVVVTYANGTYTGKAGDVTVFTMKIEQSGSYTFKLFEQLDHANGSDPNDEITLNFGVVAKDSDNDTDSTTITVKVKDDAPDAKDDSRAAGEGQTITGNVTDNDIPGQDTPATVTKVTFNGADHTVPNAGTVVIAGTYGTLTIDKTGAYSYTAKSNNPDGTDNFTYTLKDRDGDTDTANLCIEVTPDDDCPVIVKPTKEVVDETNLKDGAITETGTVTADFGSDGPGKFSGNNNFSSGGSRTDDKLSHNGTPVVVTFANDTYTGKAGDVTVFTMKIEQSGSYTFKLFEQLDHADGSNPDDEITLNFGVKATDTDGDSDSTTITVKVKDDAPDAKDDARSAGEGQTITGNVTNNDIVGQDTPGTVTKVVFKGVEHTVPTSGNVVINGTYGTLTIDKTGAYSYTAKSNNPDGTDSFTYTLKDRDGDTDTAVLCVEVSPNDDCPVIVKPAAEIVDETNLKDGAITETGTVTANFFSDGPGTFAGNNSFTSGGSRTNGTLSHNGTPVAVTFANGTYTGKAGDVTVFTMKIEQSGSYTFKLFEQLDHADGSNPNDEITLNFGVKATDADGDSDSTTIVVKVKDDAPDAKDDGRATGEGQTITGNVTNNDVPGQDTPATVTKVVFKGTEFTVPTTGTVVINGTYGTLTIGKTGEYSYTAKGNNPDGTDNFTYTLTDRDGDSDTANLCIEVTPDDDCPIIAKPDVKCVDETDLKDGAVTATGSVKADFGNDGPGTFAATNSFTSGGSRLADKLTHNGTPVVVTLANGVYTGKAGDVTVFTMKIEQSGSYTFKLLQQLDHKDGNDANDIINLNFGVKATDKDGDVATTTVTVQVKDDAPVAVNDSCTLTICDRQVSSNVLTNDKFGQDVPGRLYSVTVNGKVHTLPTSGSLDLATTYGILTIAASGAYTYKLKGNGPNCDAVESFTMKIKDFDGDSSTSTLKINLITDPHTGGAGDDTLNGNDSANTIIGNGGHDYIYAKGGNDTVRGGDGHDYIDGGQGNDTIYGDAGNDELIGRQGDDIIYGGSGNDDIYGDGGTGDTYAGNDKLYGEDGDDYIFAGAGNDYIDGGSGNDSLYGWTGNDTIIGGAGNDNIVGGAGADILTGGSGADTFWYMAINEGVDRIKDFNRGEGDKLELSNVLTNFDPVTDAITDFVFANHSGGHTTISVNNAGTGAAGATQIAVLENVNVSVTDLFNNGNIVV